MPAPELTTDALWNLLAVRSDGVLATIKRDGRPQLSNISYHYDPETRILRTQAATFRAKYNNMLRDPRVSIHVSSEDFRLWVVAEGTAEVGEPVQTHDDAVGRESVAYIRARYPELSDAELEEHLAEYPVIGRALIAIKVERIYGGNGSIARGISAS
ncbi:MAG TPA: TIGR03618 family F420-dependent PPOX class oxidoreductase [Thermomicrobiales bacterium]|nr:TIGR03618 family F420-dependent PPOX class oxidoreductase [Thermomicrobiales bacterium]